MNNPLVSIIMTNFNYGKFINEAIEGVLSQTYKNWEFIIVDDGSSDDSREIIKRFAQKEPRIKYIFKENGGQCHSFNEGYAISKGEIIALLDSDDYYYPHMLERKVELHKKAGIVDSTLSKNGSTPMMLQRKDVNWSQIYRKWGYVFKHNNTSGLSFSKESIDEFLPLGDAKTMYGGLDRVIICLAMMKSDMIIDDVVCGFYREHAEHTSKSRKEFYEDIDKTVLFFREYCTKQINKVYKDFKFRGDEYLVHLLEQCKNTQGINTGAFYGTGLLASALFRAAKVVGINVIYFSDSNENVWNKKINDTLVLSPDELFNKRNEFDKVIIASSQSKEIGDFLAKKGFDAKRDIIILPI